LRKSRQRRPRLRSTTWPPSPGTIWETSCS
jgi:hypothetical protein